MKEMLIFVFINGLETNMYTSQLIVLACHMTHFLCKNDNDDVYK